MDIWTTDIGNAYLEEYTKEKIFIIAGLVFGEREGRHLIISKVLYGLKSSSLPWWDRLSIVLHKMGFFPSKVEDDTWMKENKELYKYISRYVDDLAVISNDPNYIIEELSGKYNFTLKG